MDATFSRLSRSFQTGFCTTAFIGICGIIGINASQILNMSSSIETQFVFGGFALGISTCATQYKGYKNILAETFDWHCDIKDNIASFAGLSVGLKTGLVAGFAVGIPLTL